MEGVVSMVGWIIVGICVSILLGFALYGVYMAYWGVWND